MSKPLTAASVLKFGKAKDRIEIPDGGCPGLYLVIQPTGSKSWALRYRRPDGRPAKLALGSVFVKERGTKEPDEAPAIGGHLTLAAAHRLVSQLRHEIAQGLDPAAAYLAERQSRRETIEKGAANTFATAARRFIDEYKHKKTGRKPRRRRETARLLGLAYPTDMTEPTVVDGGLADRWKDRPVAEITEDDLFRVVDEARTRGVPGTNRRNAQPSEPRARAMNSALSVMFGWLKAKRLISVDTSAGLDAPAAPSSRDRTLNDSEIVKFWNAAGKLNQPFGPLLKLLLLTGCRLNEVAGMKWDELDREKWTVPGNRTKNHRPHAVPLPSMVSDLIASAPKIEKSEFVFTTTGRSPVSGWSKTKIRLDEEMGDAKPWRLHDLRRTAATGMANLGIAPHIVEAVLNHISGAKAGVAGIYNQAAYAEEKKSALERWSSHIAGLIGGKPAKVVPFQRGRSDGA